MVPETRSVVSRNSVVDDSTPKAVKTKEALKPEKAMSQFQLDELKKAQELKDKGIITEDEYNALKDKIEEL